MFTYKRMFFICMLSINGSYVFSMEKSENKRLSNLQSMLIGSGTGAAETITGCPLSYFANRIIQQKPISGNPLVWYRGLPANLICMMPTAAMMIGVNDGLSKILPGDTKKDKITRATLAGIFAAIPATGTELVVMHQQNNGTNIFATTKWLTKRNGPKALMRGYLPTMLREQGWALGYLVMKPTAEEYIKKYMKNKNEKYASYLSGSLTGIGTAALTHPFHVIKTKIQEDPYNYKEKYASMGDAIKSIYNQDGIRGFGKGFKARGTRAGVAMITMSIAQEKLTQCVQRNRK